MSTPLRRFLRYAWPYSGLIVLGTLAGMVKFILPSTMALTLRFITDRLVTPSPPAQESDDVIMRGFDAYLRWVEAKLPASMHGSWTTFNLLMVTLVLLYAFWGVCLYLRGYWTQLAGHRVIIDLRTDLFRHLMGLSHDFFHARQSGAIVSRLTADVALAQNFIGSAMTNIWMDLVSCVFYVYVLFSMDSHLAWASLAVFPFYIASMRMLGDRSKETSREVQEAIEALAGHAGERVAGIHLVKSFVAERRESRAFFARLRALFALTMRNVQVSTLANGIVNWLTQMATLAIIWYGGWRLIRGETSVGTVVAFILLLRELYLPVNRISEMNTIVHNALAAIERIFEIFDLEPQVRECPGARAPGRLSGRITLDRVTFGYDPKRPVLRDVTLEIVPGETLALVGPSGAGKSSLVQLLPRFFDPQVGRILVDGMDLRDLALWPLRAQIGVVAQDTILFSGTVRENIAYGQSSPTDAAIQAAARAAHAHEFIARLPGGYDAVIGERGARLSGGQRQRLAIARVFLAEPRVLILDEATSALDVESERLIQASLARLMKNRTSVVIAHRLSTVIHATRIAVFDDGTLIDVGPHAELLKRCALYRRLCETSFATPDQTVSAA